MLYQLSADWFSTLADKLVLFGISTEIKDKYNSAFEKIITLSLKNSRRSTYLNYLDTICKCFAEEVVVPIQTFIPMSNEKGNTLGKDIIDKLNELSDENECDYLREALGCWEHNYLKGATVLIWCAAIDRIHRKIEEIGFEKFNAKSLEMKKATKGRFKKYNKEYSISSISELRMVFDSDILWIIEGLGLIDSNQKNRLSSCFEMRCHSGHPGEAPITKYNVLSCFSDVVEIVLTNNKFVL